ncbi:MAG: nitroreductase family protein [Lachnospiraceae bacterium]
MSFLDLAKRRYSVRTYLTKKVEQEQIDRILEAAWVAPTAANKQPQRIFVLQSEEALEKVGKAARVFQAPLVFLICSDTREAWQRRHDGHQSTDIDASIITDHMMLEATELGLGSVWICAFRPQVIIEEFELPEYLVPVNLLAVGYADEEPLSANRHKGLRKEISETVIYK